MTKHEIFLFSLLSFIGGIAFYSFVNPALLRQLADQGGVLVLGVAIIIYAFFKNNFQFKPNTKIIFGFCILIFGFGLWRAATAFNKKPDFEKYNFQNNTVLVGKTSEEPDIRSDFSYYVLEVSNGDKILIKTNLYPEYFYGDTLKITGKIEEPTNFSDFDYKNYLAKDNIFFTGKYPKIELVSRGGATDFYGLLLEIKKMFINRINEILPEPQASFLAALLLGARRSLPKDLIEAFNATGTSHIVAISGYNISLIAIMLFNFFGFMLVPRRIIFWLVGILIILFTLIAGAGASVVRAAIMGSLLLISKREGRFYNMKNAIVLAGAAMLFFNPYLFRYDAGFQLSFLATLGLFYLSPHFERRFVGWRIPNFFSFRDNLAATLSAQIAALPVVLFSFGRFSWLSVPANVLVLPAVPPAMLSGFLAALVGFISVKIGSIVALATWFLLSYQIWVVELLSAFIS